MSKAEWGKKVVCPECGTKFYDLNRKYPLECVNCGFVIKLETETKVSSSAKKVYEDDLETEVDNKNYATAVANQREGRTIALTLAF